MTTKSKIAFTAGILAAGFGVQQLVKRNNVPSPSPQIASLTINQPPSTITRIIDLSPIQATRGVAISRQLSTVNCTDPCIWHADNLPVGLTLTFDGLIVGIPTQIGTYLSHITVKSAPTLWGDGSSKLYSDGSSASLQINVQ